MRALVAKVGAMSFLAGASLELVLQLSGYNKILEDSAERKRLDAEIEERHIEERLKKKYGAEKFAAMTSTSNQSSDKPL